MLKKILLVSTLFLLVNCGATGNKSGAGILYTETIDPLFVDNNVKSTKKGRACSERILALFAHGDASIGAAKVNGNITKIAVANTEYYNIMGIYGEACTVVTGE
jgi:TRL-like protein family